jgi:hypothetical protein
MCSSTPVLLLQQTNILAARQLRPPAPNIAAAAATAVELIHRLLLLPSWP